MSEQLRVLRLDQILNETQLRAVESIVAQVRAGSTKLDSLRFYLVTQEAELAAKDVDPNFLFYAVSYASGLF